MCREAWEQARREGREEESGSVVLGGEVGERTSERRRGIGGDRVLAGLWREEGRIAGRVAEGGRRRRQTPPPSSEEK